MLKEIYREFKPSVVAIALSKRTDEHFFTILGTGFFLREDGVIVTNRHVIDAINELPQVKAGADPFAEACVLFFHQNTEGHMRVLPLEIENFWLVDQNLPKDAKFYGEEPDLAIITLMSVKDCPAVKVYNGEYCEGESVAVSGFPLGTTTLKILGWVQQVTPTLKVGVIGAVLPFNCKTPHALLLDIMMQGGSSGSPVFLPQSGEVVGVISSGINGTNLSYCVPSWYLTQILVKMNEKKQISESRDKKTPLMEWIKSRHVHSQTPKGPMTESWPE